MPLVRGEPSAVRGSWTRRADSSGVHSELRKKEVCSSEGPREGPATRSCSEPGLRISAEMPVGVSMWSGEVCG